MTCKVGDWVAFMRDNRVVYALVMYRAQDILHKWVLTTSHGRVNEEDVLEVKP